MKILVACSPAGEPPLTRAGGHHSRTDNKPKWILNVVDHGDMIIADKGFPGIKSTLDAKGKKVLIVMLPFFQNGTFTADEVHETQKVASIRNIRIHIERIMQRIKTFRITAKFPVKEYRYLDDIIFMACVPVNLQPPIIRENSNNE